MYSDGLRYYSKNDEAREKNAVADGIANGAITLIWESKFDHESYCFISFSFFVVWRLFCLSADCRSWSRMLMSSCSLLSRQAIASFWKFILCGWVWRELGGRKFCSLSLSPPISLITRHVRWWETENFLSAYVIFPKSANPTCVFLGNVCKLGSVLQRKYPMQQGGLGIIGIAV